MECRLRDFALVFLKWLMFKSFIIIGISKIEFLSQNLLNPYVNDFPSNINKFQIFFWFFSETLILLLTVRHWMGETTDLSLDSNISKTVKINVTFSHHF